MRKLQQGIVLIDAMIAILIFSVGVLGMVALQGSAVEMTGAANYRVNAAMLADQVIAQMWADTPSSISSDFTGSSGTGGSKYASWYNTADCTSSSAVFGCLPGVKANPPSISVAAQTIPNSGNTQYQVTVTVYWQAPSDSSVHKYVSVTSIGY
jgi:type IV pilus assembly protein PilV